jgi:hypothetical protein
VIFQWGVKCEETFNEWRPSLQVIMKEILKLLQQNTYFMTSYSTNALPGHCRIADNSKILRLFLSHYFWDKQNITRTGRLRSFTCASPPAIFRTTPLTPAHRPGTVELFGIEGMAVCWPRVKRNWFLGIAFSTRFPRLLQLHCWISLQHWQLSHSVVHKTQKVALS